MDNVRCERLDIIDRDHVTVTKNGRQFSETGAGSAIRMFPWSPPFLPARVTRWQTVLAAFLSSRVAGSFNCKRPDFIYANALERGANSRVLIKRARSHHLKWYGMFTHHQAMVYRRAVVEGQWFDLTWKIGADYAFTLDTLSKSVRVARVQAPLVLFEGGGRSQTQAALGRWDQAQIRRSHLNMSGVSCFLIMIAQYAAISIRRLWPAVFETWRCHRMYE